MKVTSLFSNGSKLGYDFQQAIKGMRTKSGRESSDQLSNYFKTAMNTETLV